MPTLKVTIVQPDLVWHDASANRAALTRMIDSSAESTDLIVLPEMFTTGFSMNAPELAETMAGPTMEWLRDTAARHEAAVCGSVIIREDERYFNRFICVDNRDKVFVYDKRHLFRLADEQLHYASGNSLVTFEIGGFRICPMVCYDLRFPVWSRNRDNYDVLLYVANWPDRRHHAWKTLLRARAIENLSFVVGVNRVGTDGNDLPYVGGSAVIDFLGHEMVDLGDSTGVATASLDLGALEQFRDRFAFHRDADNFKLTGD